MEYYLGDENLSKDDFFRDQILKNPKTGYINLSVFLNCNKIKKLNITEMQIVDACKDSALLEFNKELTQIRRKNNKELPTQVASLKKRDQKANDKSENAKKDSNGVQAEEKDEPVQRDEMGRVIFH
jgi:hypothetical protein